MLYIIIPVFNRITFTKECLTSIRNQTYKEFKTIVVDDGSTDGTYEILKKDFPEVIVISTEGNLFWTSSINVGIEKALIENATHILTLNNDTILSENFIRNMVSWSIKKPNALLGALAIDQNKNTPVYAGGIINWRTASIESLLKSDQNLELNGLKQVDHFPGRGLLIPKVVFEKCGLFNQKIFPHYMADFDFTHQAYICGFEIYCNYDAVLFTYPEESGDRIIRNKKNFNNYYNHLFGIKGGGNLRNFIFFAFRNCPKSYLPTYILIGIFKRVFGYLIK